VSAEELGLAEREPVDAGARRAALEIVEAVRAEGAAAVRRFAGEFDGLGADESLVLGKEAMSAASERIDAEVRGALERAAGRIGAFAREQLASVRSFEMEIGGGVAGQTWRAMERAGCYAPGGRYPLPSSVLMTVCPARAAGVERVVLATPGVREGTARGDVMLAAAGIAGADAVLRVGGAQAVAALAYGLGAGGSGEDVVLKEGVDVVVGPGNAYVTAAKQLVSGVVAIDMLAGPSELVVIADGEADAGTVAADLLAQAEHDPMASVTLISLDSGLVERVNAALSEQLEALPTRAVAEASVRENGRAVVVGSAAEAVALSDRLAPEHLEVMVGGAEESRALAEGVRHAGAVFIGEGAAEVFGDFGLGPNHTLPTGGTARSFAGLSVHTFLRARTHIRCGGGLGESDGSGRLDALAMADAVTLARVEGLEGHARSAERRMRL